MVGLISDPIGSPALNADPSAYAPSSTFERADPLSLDKQLGRANENQIAVGGAYDSEGNEISVPEAPVSADVANSRYGIPGQLKFDSALPLSVAANMNVAKQEEMRRQDAAARSPGGTGVALTDFAAGMLDPLNIAASFIPVVGEARVGGMLARAGFGALSDQGAGFVARSTLRAATGFVDGGIAQAPLVGLRYGLSQQEQADYTAQDAMADLAMGSLLGGGLHVAGGAAGDLIKGLRAGGASVPEGAGNVAGVAPPSVVEPGEPVDPLASTGPQAQVPAPVVQPLDDGLGPAATAPAAPVPQPSLIFSDVPAPGGPDPVGEAFRASPGAALVDADPELREAVLRSSIAAVAEGRPVAAAELLDVAGAERGSVPPAEPGAIRTVYAPGVAPIQVRPEVVPLDSLTASHGPDGALNPAYPHEAGIQPRDRTSPQSQADVRSIAANLQPDRMDVSPEAHSGSPIVSRDGVVESGNGRTMALGQVYADPALVGRAAAYKDWLNRQGYDTAGIDKPVLVARRVSDLTPDQTRAFGRAANESTTLKMTAAEMAHADAARAGAALDLWRGNSVTDASNRDFVRAFMGQLPSAERGNMTDAGGGLSAEGARRVQAAVLAQVYGDDLGPTLGRMLNGETEGTRAISGAVSDAAGAWGKMRLAAARGEIPAGLDITQPLGEAVQTVERQRRAGRPVSEAFAQQDVFGGGPSPEAAALTRLMFNDAEMRRPVSRQKLADMLTHYADQASQVSPEPDIFGQRPASAADILAAVSKRADVIDQASLFGRGSTDTAAQRLQDLQDSPAARRAMGAPDPEQAAIEQRAADAAREPSAATPPAPADLPQLEEFMARAREAGRLDPQSESEMAASDESQSRSQKFVDALMQAGDCVLRSTV